MRLLLQDLQLLVNDAALDRPLQVSQQHRSRRLKLLQTLHRYGDESLEAVHALFRKTMRNLLSRNSPSTTLWTTTFQSTRFQFGVLRIGSTPMQSRTGVKWLRLEILLQILLLLRRLLILLPLAIRAEGSGKLEIPTMSEVVVSRKPGSTPPPTEVRGL